MIIVISPLWTNDVISVWLLLYYKSFGLLCGVSITDPGMTPEHRELTIWGRVATEMASEHTLTVGHDH